MASCTDIYVKCLLNLPLMYFKSLLKKEFFYIGGFIAKKMVVDIQSIECADELYNSFGQEHSIKSKANLLSCNPINDNLFAPTS